MNNKLLTDLIDIKNKPFIPGKPWSSNFHRFLTPVEPRSLGLLIKVGRVGEGHPPAINYSASSSRSIAQQESILYFMYKKYNFLGWLFLLKRTDLGDVSTVSSVIDSRDFNERET